MTTTSEAGAKGGVALAPSVAISLSNVARIARLAGLGAPVAIGGALTVASRGPPAAMTTTTTAKGSSEASGAAAVGVALGLTIVDHQVRATIQRNVTAGGAVTVEALGQSVVSSGATASAKGAPGEGEAGAPAGGVDGQVLAERDLADAQAADAGAGGSGGMTPPSAKSSTGPISVAAAVAVSVVDTSALASIVAGVTIVSGATVTVMSGAKTDSSAAADGSSSTDAGSLAVGAAIAINLANINNNAVIAGTVTAQGLAVNAGINEVGADDQHTLAATAVSGASGANASIAVSLALNIANVDTLAELASGATVTVTAAGLVDITAASKATSTVEATPHEPAVGTKFGIGASIALNLIDDEAIARISGATVNLAAASDVTVSTGGGHQATTLAEAGAGSAGVALVPSVAVTISTVGRTATVAGAGTPLTVGGNLTVSVEVGEGANDTSTTAKGSSSSSGSAAIGIALAITIANHAISATIERTANVGGDVTVRAAGQSKTGSSAEASSKGAPASGTPGAPDAGGAGGNVDPQVAAERDLANSQAMDNGGDGAAEPAQRRRRRRRRVPSLSQLPLP